MLNEIALDSVCASLCYAMGIEAPNAAADKNKLFCDYIDQKAGDQKFDRIFMYNPDAIAQWIFEKYTDLFPEGQALCDLKNRYKCVILLSLLFVCHFYTGAHLWFKVFRI